MDRAAGEDARIAHYIDGLSDADFTGRLIYRTVTNPTTIEQDLWPALDHFFNHQAHHRGQVHGLLSAIVGNAATPSLDLLVLQRETGIGNLHRMAD